MNKIIRTRIIFESNLHNKVLGSVCLCSSKGPDQKNEETKVVTKYDPKQVKKEDMKWRTAWHEKEGHYYTTLQSFSSDDNQRYVMKWLQSDFDLSPSGIKKWLAKRKEKRDIALQSYLQERNDMVGNELAAAHFIVHRGGSVKFHGENNWIKANSLNQYNLPRRYDKTKFIQAIDCSGVDLYYEGLANFKELRKVEWFSLNDCSRTDDWFLDRISNLFSHSLIYLDLRDCPNYTYRGLGALYKMSNLKILYIDNRTLDPRFEMTCILLQEHNPNLDIQIDN